MNIFNEANRSIMDSRDNQKSLVSQSHEENSNMTDLLSTHICKSLRTGNQGSNLACAGGSCFDVNNSVLQKQQQNGEAEIIIDRNTDRGIYDDPNSILNSNYLSLDCRIKCFVCGELVDKQKLSGHLIFGELKCSQCFLEIKTCEQFQALKSYQNTFYQNMTSYHHNQTSFPHNQSSCQQTQNLFPQKQNFCQHKDFVWPISPTPIDFLKENLSGEMDNTNVEVCCYIANLSLLASAKPWKVVIHSYWQVKENKACLYCQKSKVKFTLKAMLSRPFKPNIPKQKTKITKTTLELHKNSQKILTNEIHTVNLPRTPSLKSQKTEKYTLLKSILDQPVRYNFDIINNIHASRKCNIQDNNVSSSQTHIVLV